MAVFVRRACRLKKKAQHEANKIKLLGLEYEHSNDYVALDDRQIPGINCLKWVVFFSFSERLINCINHMKQLLATRVVPGATENPETSKNVDKMIKHATSEYRR